jgi:sugar phosphate isomerase/epimerase
MTLTRREMLAACATALPGIGAWAAGPGERQHLGIVIHSFPVRTAADRAAGKPGIAEPLAFVEHCHALGAGGVQVGIGARDQAYLKQLRKKLDAFGMYLEGIVRLPADRADVDRFDAEVRSAKEAGAAVARTVLLNGRRYETFGSAAEFDRWAERSFRSLGLAEPVVARHGVRLAVENHKDYRADEQVAVLKRIDSRQVGVCLDTGNSIALLEEPMEFIEALAPWAFTTHFKDMAVAEYEDGFLLAEVPLGDGFLDLKKVIETLRRSRPDIRFNLEMITRDPLRVPCLTAKYWTTFEALPGRHLARVLRMVRENKPRQPLARISNLSREQQLAVEEANVRKSLAYARDHLAL